MWLQKCVVVYSMIWGSPYSRTLCVFYTVLYGSIFYSSHDAAVAPRVVSLFLQLAPGCLFHIREGVWLPHPVVLHAAKTPHGPVPHEQALSVGHPHKLLRRRRQGVQRAVHAQVPNARADARVARGGKERDTLAGNGHRVLTTTLNG